MARPDDFRAIVWPRRPHHKTGSELLWCGRPARTWIVTVFVMLAAGLSAAAAQETPTPYGTAIEVNRILTEVRVVDRDHLPVPDLRPEEFVVTIDGTRVEVESVTWIPAVAETAVSPRTQATAVEPWTVGSPPAPEGRLIIIVFQTDPAPRHARTVGLVKITPLAAEFVRNLGPADRVAMLVFGSHLELRSDFTADHESIAESLNVQEVLRGRSDRLGPSSPSLADHFDFEEARDAASMSSALEVIGNALKPIPGTKSLVFFGFGLGRMSAGTAITVGDGYDRAMQALTAARCSVFSLDFTDADFHSLELGQRKIAEDTGGLYVKTHTFPKNAMKMLTGVISSYYELSIVPPPDLGDSYKIKVKVARRGTTVYVRQYHPS